MGPISYREVMHYADEMALNDDSREFLWEVIRRLDAAFLKMSNEKTGEQAAAERARREAHPGGRRTSRH